MAQPEMRLLDRHGRIVSGDEWVGLADDAPTAGHMAVVVSLKRFLAERDVLLSRDFRLGVRLDPNEGPEALAPDLERISAIFVAFPVFRDGRGFSTARILRSRYRFSGEIRAVGDIARDQLFFLLRAGFDAFELRDRDHEAAFKWAQDSFSVVYQPAADHAAPAFARRAHPPSEGQF
jgi:uncharacterized protein (DUF934 family)